MSETVEDRQESDAASEARWWEKRRQHAPNLHAVIDAAYAKLEDPHLTSKARMTLETMMVGLSVHMRGCFEINESDRDEALRQIGDL